MSHDRADQAWFVLHFTPTSSSWTKTADQILAIIANYASEVMAQDTTLTTSINSLRAPAMPSARSQTSGKS